MSESNGHNDNVLTLLQEAHDQLEAKDVELKDIRSMAGNLANNQELLQEALAELELALEDTGWQRLSGFGDREFSTVGLRKLRRLARLNYLKNPLIRHAVEVQAHYVWGQGMTVSASNDKVNDVVQAFVEDPKNISTFSGHQARLNLERGQRVSGETPLALFTNQDTGRVVVRKFVPDEIVDIITNPDDYQEPWFYKREWVKRTFDADAESEITDTEITYYPDWRLTYNTDSSVPNPRTTRTINGKPVEWDAPIYFIKTGGFDDQKRGCPEVYPALDWARAVKDDLEDYATIRRAHSRFAWKQTRKGGPDAVKQSRVQLGSTLNQGGIGSTETNPPPVSGATYIQAEGSGDLTPFKTAGMQPSPEEGRRLWLMAGAGVGLPETILAGNADVGNLSTATTLDRPTELQMEDRRQFWTDVFIDIINYVVDMAIKCPNGMLADEGSEVEDTATGLVTYELDGDDGREIEIRFPSILRHEVLPLVQAIVWAITLNNGSNAGLIPDQMGAGWLMAALGEYEFDDVISQMFPNGSLSFGAGMNRPATPTHDLPTQGVQSKTDQGLGDMGGAPPIAQQGQGVNIDPNVAYDYAMFASKRIRESLGERRRRSVTRSGIVVQSRRTKTQEAKEVAL